MVFQITVVRGPRVARRRQTVNATGLCYQLPESAMHQRIEPNENKIEYKSVYFRVTLQFNKAITPLVIVWIYSEALQGIYVQ